MPNLTSYTFSLLDDATMVALWTDGIAGQYDPIGIATITIPNFSGGPVVGDDVLLGFEQELTYMDVDGDMVIPDIFVKDYPLLIKIYNSAP